MSEIFCRISQVAPAKVIHTLVPELDITLYGYNPTGDVSAVYLCRHISVRHLHVCSESFESGAVICRNSESDTVCGYKTDCPAVYGCGVEYSDERAFVRGRVPACVGYGLGTVCGDGLVCENWILYFSSLNGTHHIRHACLCPGDTFENEIETVVRVHLHIGELLKIRPLKLFPYVFCCKREWQTHGIPSSVTDKSPLKGNLIERGVV